jgi:molybdopterin-containing oxidoreductase family iron-sulfur binding subunit
MNFSRRTFMKVAALGGATLASDAGIKSVGKLVPSVNGPDPLPFVGWHGIATTCRECPAGCGMHVRHVDGRITKAEGNPDHPVNRGGLCARGQSALQGVYDPDRITAVRFRDRTSGTLRTESWQKAMAEIGERLTGKGRVAVMSRLENGALAEIMAAFASAFGSDRVLFYEAFSYDPLRRAHGTLLGRPVIPYYRLDEADYILSFGADFLETWVSNVQFARQFATMHELRQGRIGRFDYVGPRLSMTAANADRFAPVRPGREKDAALALLKIMAAEGLVKRGADVIGPLVRNLAIPAVPGLSAQDLRAMAKSSARRRRSPLPVPWGHRAPRPCSWQRPSPC